MKQQKKILVIDDELAIRRFLRVSLERENYSVSEAESGQAGIQQVIAVRPDLVVLDLGLPDMSGQDVLQKVREWSQVPIIMLTVKDDDESKVKALDAGADDYLTKPFSAPELLARIRVAERHSTSVENNSTFKSGKLEVDLLAHVVRVSGKEVHLTSTEFDILKLLIKYAGKVVTHRQILKEVWGPNSVEHTQYLRVYLGQLRKKIELDGAHKVIITEPGVGYRLVV